jgi:hypothetical protein
VADIYGIDSKLAGTFKGTTFALSLGGGTGDFRGALVQAINLSYMRQITRVYEIGSLNQYFIEGHVEGQAQLQRIVGPQGLVDQLTRNLADICTATSRVISLSAVNNTCTSKDGGTITLESPVVTNFTLGSQVANFVIDSSIAVTFTGLLA